MPYSKVDVIELSGDIFECCDADRAYTVAFFEGKILLYGDIGSNDFTYTGPMKKEALELAFPDRKAAVRAALKHTRGILNKKIFKESVEKLDKDKRITAHAVLDLMEFIDNCNCAPSRVLEKLIHKGYASIVGDLNFYEESPEMFETTQALIDFIHSFRGA